MTSTPPALPATFRKLVATEYGKDYRSIAQIIEVPLEAPGPGQVLIRNLYAGVNASDINLTSGAYGSLPSLPMDLGVEAVGRVAAVGEGVDTWKVGDSAAYLAAGAYGEYLRVNARWPVHVSRADPEVVPLLASAMTAAVGLHHVGEMKADDTVLVTGAAGGTGQFAVQLAKLAGHRVVAVCGSDDKAALLMQLGADQVVNYRRESLSEVLADQFPRGVDLVYECVGGEIFDICLEHLAPLGRLLVVGYISEYQHGPEPVLAPRVYSKLLWKSASIRGFVSSMYPKAVRAETLRVLQLWEEGQLRSLVDPSPFCGLESVAAALDHLYSGRSTGKVIVRL